MTFMSSHTLRSRRIRILAAVAAVALLVVGGVAGRHIVAQAGSPGLPPPPPLTPGGPAPAFTAVDTRGGSHSIADHAGQWVVLEWVNHECPYTKKHYALVNGVGNTQAMQAEYTRRGVIWLSIVSSAAGKQGYTSAAEADRLTREKGAAPTGVVLDTAGVIGRLYGARNTPQYAIIDPTGVVRYSGAIDDRRSSRVRDIPGATNYVRAALDAGLTGQPIAVAQTQPYGCGVKY